MTEEGLEHRWAVALKQALLSADEEALAKG
jgi:hypothetical protein